MMPWKSASPSLSQNRLSDIHTCPVERMGKVIVGVAAVLAIGILVLIETLI